MGDRGTIADRASKKKKNENGFAPARLSFPVISPPSLFPVVFIFPQSFAQVGNGEEEENSFHRSKVERDLAFERMADAFLSSIHPR